MKNIIILTDYNDKFGSKWTAEPYRSGMNKNYLKKIFLKKQFKVQFMPMCQLDFLNPKWKNWVFLYTSSEEYGLHYKNFIEDVVFGLKEIGANVLPNPVFLKANNNKVFMEILRKIKLPENLQTIASHIFGTFEELEHVINCNLMDYPCVIKESEGAQGRGVFLAQNKNALRQIAMKISRTASLKGTLKEKVRIYRHKGYAPESSYQKKFIIQPFVSGLKNDWKILIYGEKYFVLKRKIRKNDFRASGSGYNYTSGTQAGFPEKMLNMVRDVYLRLDVPNLSLDFAFDGKKGYVFEFQAIHFGTSTHYLSKDYYEYRNGSWVVDENDLDEEQVYVHSIVNYLER